MSGTCSGALLHAKYSVNSWKLESFSPKSCIFGEGSRVDGGMLWRTLWSLFTGACDVRTKMSFEHDLFQNGVPLASKKAILKNPCCGQNCRSAKTPANPAKETGLETPENVT